MGLPSKQNHCKTGVAIVLGAFVLLIAGCTNHYMTKQMMLDQLFSQDQLKSASTPQIL